MKKRSLKIVIPVLVLSLVFIFAFTGCSFLGVTIEPPKIHLDPDNLLTMPGKADKSDTPEIAVEEPRPEEGKDSDQEILASFDEAISGVVEKVLPSVVNIRVVVDQQDVFGNTSEDEGVGSGVIYSPDGYILTNSHVASEAKELTVTMNDGQEYPATLVGADADRDIAVIKIEATDLNPAEFTFLEEVKVGELAIAVGSPFGLQETVTVGVISAIGRDIPVSYERLPMIDLIQTDAAINPGNSGGALVNSAGQVLGINTMIFSPSGANAGIGFAIPSDIALNVADQIINNGGTELPYIGIQMGENTSDIKGVLVEDTIDGYPAAEAGIKAGDIITAVDGVGVESSFELVALLLRYEPGDTVTVTINRDGQISDVNIVLAARPVQTEG